MSGPRTTSADLGELDSVATLLKSEPLANLLADDMELFRLLRIIRDEAVKKNALSRRTYIEACEWLEEEPDEKILDRFCAAEEAQESIP